MRRCYSSAATEDDGLRVHILVARMESTKLPMGGYTTCRQKEYDLRRGRTSRDKSTRGRIAHMEDYLQNASMEDEIEEPPEIFPGTREALERLTIRKADYE